MDKNTKRAVDQAVRNIEKRVAAEAALIPTAAEQRESLRRALASEGLVLKPDGSVRGKSDKES